MSRRPKTIQELADLATTHSYDPNRSFKDQLRAADYLRREGKAQSRQGNLEEAFVNTARAATIILDKIPKHPGYLTLTREQKDGLASNGHDCVELLGRLKASLTDQYDRWNASGSPHDDEEDEEEEDDLIRQGRDRRRQVSDEQTQLREEDLYRRRDAEERERQYKKRQEEEARALRQRQAAEYERAARRRDEEIRAQRRFKEETTSSYVNPMPTYDAPGMPGMPGPAQRSSMERISEPLVPRPMPQPQTNGRINYPASQPPPAPPAFLPYSQPPNIAYVTPPRRDELDFSSPGPLPLESPNHVALGVGNDEEPSPFNPLRRPSYPPPVTTTSPPRSNEHIEYPKLMTAHQLQQGYRPSTSSMFSQSQLLFNDAPHPSSYGTSPNSLPRPPADLLPTLAPPNGPSHSVSYPSLPQAVAPIYGYPSQPPMNRNISVPAFSPPRRQPSYPGISDPLPPLPKKIPVSPLVSQSASAPPAIPEETDDDFTGLRTVWLPEETLHKFIRIAAVNTTRKVETCGLLLGRRRGKDYVVQTLLVPRQTSDENSCTMDHEELIVDFTIKRDLVTLGWIHTHPTQSCFMSSLDLHTHSGYQSALPEAFAIVCAPRSNPSFGIFRLTEPPGLDIIVNCKDKRAFHPHPDQPIYTDADSGHVRVNADIPLEIVDLRPD